MVLTCMHLLNHSTHTGLIRPHYYKLILTEETHFSVSIYNFDVSQVLSVGTHFVLTFYNKSALIL